MSSAIGLAQYCITWCLMNLLSPRYFLLISSFKYLISIASLNQHFFENFHLSAYYYPFSMQNICNINSKFSTFSIFIPTNTTNRSQITNMFNSTITSMKTILALVSALSLMCFKVAGIITQSDFEQNLIKVQLLLNPTLEFYLRIFCVFFKQP